VTDRAADLCLLRTDQLTSVSELRGVADSHTDGDDSNVQANTSVELAAGTVPSSGRSRRPVRRISPARYADLRARETRAILDDLHIYNRTIYTAVEGKYSAICRMRSKVSWGKDNAQSQVLSLT